MKLDKLIRQHEKEIDDYLQQRARRSSELQTCQREIIENCIVLNNKAHELLKDLLTEQRQAWEQMEADELDMLLHMQDMELTSFLDEEKKREEFMALFKDTPDKEKDRGR